MRPEDFLTLNARNISAITQAADSVGDAFVSAAKSEGDTLLSLYKFQTEKALKEKELGARRLEIAADYDLRKDQIEERKTLLTQTRDEAARNRELTMSGKLLSLSTTAAMEPFNLQINELQAAQKQLVADADRYKPGDASEDMVLAGMNPNFARYEAERAAKFKEANDKILDNRRKIDEANRAKSKIGTDALGKQQELIQSARKVSYSEASLPSAQGGEVGELLLNNTIHVPVGGEYKTGDKLQAFSTELAPVGEYEAVENANVVDLTSANPSVAGAVRSINSQVVAADDFDPNESAVDYDSRVKASAGNYGSVGPTGDQASSPIMPPALPPARDTTTPLSDTLGMYSFPTKDNKSVHYIFSQEGVTMQALKAGYDLEQSLGGADNAKRKLLFQQARQSATIRPIDLAKELTNIDVTTTLSPMMIAKGSIDEKGEPTDQAFRAKKIQQIESLRKGVLESSLPDSYKSSILPSLLDAKDRQYEAAFSSYKNNTLFEESSPALEAVKSVFKPKVRNLQTGQEYESEQAYLTEIEKTKKAAKDKMDSDTLKASLEPSALQSKFEKALFAQSKPDQIAAGVSPFGVRLSIDDIDYKTGEWKNREAFKNRVINDYKDSSGALMLRNVINATGDDPNGPDLTLKLPIGADGKWDDKAPLVDFRVNPRNAKNNAALGETGPSESDIAYATEREAVSKRSLALIRAAADDRHLTDKIFAEMTAAYAEKKLNELK